MTNFNLQKEWEEFRDRPLEELEDDELAKKIANINKGVKR